MYSHSTDRHCLRRTYLSKPLPCREAVTRCSVLLHGVFGEARPRLPLTGQQLSAGLQHRPASSVTVRLVLCRQGQVPREQSPKFCQGLSECHKQPRQGNSLYKSLHTGAFATERVCALSIWQIICQNPYVISHRLRTNPAPSASSFFLQSFLLRRIQVILLLNNHTFRFFLQILLGVSGNLAAFSDVCPIFLFSLSPIQLLLVPHRVSYESFSRYSPSTQRDVVKVGLVDKKMTIISSIVNNSLQVRPDRGEYLFTCSGNFCAHDRSLFTFASSWR